MQGRHGGQHGAGVERQRSAIEFAEHGTSFAHDHGQRGDVEDVHVRPDDRIDGAAQQVVLMHEIAVAACSFGAADQFGPRQQAARGAVDAVIESDVNILDIAALAVIVREAGGTFTDLAGEAVGLGTTSVLASNGPLHQPVLGRIRFRR